MLSLIKRQRIPNEQSKWTIQINWQHRVHNMKRQKLPNGQSKMDNPDKLATQGTQYEALETTEWAIKIKNEQSR